MLKIFGLGVLAAGGLVMIAGQAAAAGCNGHVNVAEWGCAPWDNNNGPKFPHYKAPPHRAEPPVVKAAPQPHLAQPTAPAIGNNGNGTVSSGHNGVVSQGGGNAIGNNGSSAKPGNRNGVVSQGGGNIMGNSSGNLVGSGGASLRQK